ncbi:MAG: hypothetical protein AB4041_11190 [Microcystaceae cyanobacterium]
MLTKDLILEEINSMSEQQLKAMLNFIYLLKDQEQSSVHNSVTLTEGKKMPLEGTVYYYDDPFEPVAEDEWEVLQ